MSIDDGLVIREDWAAMSPEAQQVYFDQNGFLGRAGASIERRGLLVGLNRGL